MPFPTFPSSAPKSLRQDGVVREEEFVQDSTNDTFRCPAGQFMKPRRVHPVRRTREYLTAARVCSGCALRDRCTRSRAGRTVHRHEHQEVLDRAREQAHGERSRALFLSGIRAIGHYPRRDSEAAIPI